MNFAQARFVFYHHSFLIHVSVKVIEVSLKAITLETILCVQLLTK